jgi:hypothetical protein
VTEEYSIVVDSVGTTYRFQDLKRITCPYRAACQLMLSGLFERVRVNVRGEQVFDLYIHPNVLEVVRKELTDAIS